MTIKKLSLRLIDFCDAKFILDLRSDYELNKFLQKFNASLDNQVEWIKNYKYKEEKNKEFYFIIEEDSSKKIGTIRSHDIDYKKSEFELGSFIVDKNRSSYRNAAPYALSLFFDFHFNKLGLEACHFYCKNINEKAKNFYLRYGVNLVKQDSDNVHFNYKKEKFNNAKDNFLSMKLI